MASFKNLVFLSHPMNPTRSIMAKYRFDNGKVLSVVAGEGLYSDTVNGNRESVKEESEVNTFEVMFDGEVTGWQTREDINKIFEANEVL